MWLVIVAVVAGGAWYFIGGNSDSSAADASATQQEGNTMMPSSETFDESTTLAALQEKGGSWKCTFATTGPTADSSGTVYIAGKNIRGDFESSVKQVSMTLESHMISDGAFAYTWTSSTNQGFKVPVDVNAGGDTSTAVSGSGEFDMGATLDYHCSAWPTDESMFALPAGITFTEVK